uniref:Uncharacterized protein n=2 Tax=Candidatus Kentrum sp. LFY TaxID=2126342 RepID=A0A450WK27_9GAMM|nr:MAG: hypothetical protein BECKLFY1418C_GA0070996_103128 [Candidatus Kentron sp. LFY]
MSKLDLAKEEIAYLKLWLGMVFAVGVTLIGWLLSNFQSAHWHLVAAGILALLLIGFVGYAIHTRIEDKITRIEEL